MLHDFTQGGATKRGTPGVQRYPGVLRGASYAHQTLLIRLTSKHLLLFFITYFICMFENINLKYCS